MDATEASLAALQEGVERFLGPGELQCRFVKASGGVNNRMYFVERENKPKLVLRIYNNGGNAQRVRFEHEILEALRDNALPFQVPRLVRSQSGATSVPIANMEPGTLACMFEVIPGSTARVDSLHTARSAGDAIARLVQRLATVNLPPGPNPLFRHVYAACPGRVLAPAEVERIVRGPEFEEVREEAAYLLAELARVCAVADRQTMLPEQQIHADAHLDNLLADAEGTVTGILDFEFSARDWRVMEACVGLTKYVATEGIDIRASIVAFLEGYGAGGGRLTAEEARFVPDGMVLRILSNVVFFAGRATADPPQDNIRTLVNKVRPYAKRCRWIESNRDFVVTEAMKLVL